MGTECGHSQASIGAVSFPPHFRPQGSGGSTGVAQLQVRGVGQEESPEVDPPNLARLIATTG